MTKYISDGTWFIKGTEVQLKEKFDNNIGIFEGFVIIEDEDFKKIKAIPT